MSKRSELELLFEAQLLTDGITNFLPEYYFDKTRKWRFDFAWPDIKVAVEIEGGVWSGGRHTRGKGFESDCNKYNAATIQGWRVLRFTGGMVTDRELTALTFTRRLLDECKRTSGVELVG